MALKLGDDTAASLGRITLNPVPHIDPFGTILKPLLQIFGGFSLLGWAKPPPYDPGRFRRDVSLRRGHISVAVAGPLSNLILTVFFTILFAITIHAGYPKESTEGLENIFKAGIFMNVSLMIFNLLPVPPLDGSGALPLLMSELLGQKYMSIMHNGGIAIFGIFLAWKLFGYIYSPIHLIALNVLYPDLHYR